MKKTLLTFFEHLDELRRRLLISSAAVLTGMVAGWCYSDRALKILSAPVRNEISEVYFFSPAEAFIIKIKIAFLIGLFLASPIVLSQVWLFISPALHGKEKKAVFPLIFVTSVLFFAGAAFCFFLVMPLALHFFMSMQTEFLRPMISMAEYITFVSTMLLAFGVAFNMPVFIMAFVFSGVVDAKGLNKFQKHVIVLIFIVAAILTPGPDIASQLLLAFPLVALFEISVLGAKLVEFLKKRKRQKSLEYV